MEKYANFGGASGIRAYAFGVDSITILFRDGAMYLYNHRSTGPARIAHMKRLALAGQGLNTYINHAVRKAYAARLQ